MKLQKRIAVQRQRRRYRVRNQVRAAGRVRLSVFRSNKHMYAQIIDDARGETLVAASTAETGLLDDGSGGGNAAAAASVGRAIAERALQKGIKEVAFDRGAYRFHGRVAALAEAARAAGLEF
jgi:large subunit ribosomal protein L18